MLKWLPLIGLVAILCSPHQASAHYLWVTIENQSGEHGVTRIVFEESSSAGDGHYLDHFSGTSKTWFRSVEQIEPELLKTYTRGPEKLKHNIKTDGKGRVRFTPITAGRYSLRTSIEEPTAGQEGGQDYALIRHNCTMIMQLPLEK